MMMMMMMMMMMIMIYPGGLTGEGRGAYKRKFTIYRLLRLAVFHCQTHEGVFLWVINAALMALLGACFQKVYIRRVFSQCELFHIA